MTPKPADKSERRSSPRAGAVGHVDTAEDLARDVISNLHHLQAKLPQHATRNDWYMAFAYAIRSRVLDRYIATLDAITGGNATAKIVAYFSAEFLVGPHLGNSLVSLGLLTAAAPAIHQLDRIEGIGQFPGAVV